MKIIYFDARTLLYSQSYVIENESIKESFNDQKNLCIDERFRIAKPDLSSARRLAAVASEVGALLYPTSPAIYSPQILIDHGVLPENVLAPFIDTSFRLRLDDTDWLRSTLAHSAECSADWYICGDFKWDERMTDFPDRYFHMSFETGIDETVTNTIRRAFESDTKK